MSKYIISPDGKLYHADDDYLQHWKYIKREKVNGKWKYYYDEDENKLASLQKERDDLQKNHDRKFEEYFDARKADDLKNAIGDTDPAFIDPEHPINEASSAVANVNRWYSADWVREAMKDTWESDYHGKGRYSKAEIDSKDAEIRRHNKTISGKIDKLMVNNATKIVSSLNKTSKTIEGAKTFVNSLLAKTKKKK